MGNCSIDLPQYNGHMMLRIIMLTLLLGTNYLCLAAEQNPFLVPEYSLEYNTNSDPSVDGINALLYAKQTDRRVLIEVGGNWCQWCHILDEFINEHPQVKTSLTSKFVVLKVNVSDENKNEEFMSDMPPVDGYPHIYITDTKGSIKFSGDLSSLLKRGKFSEDLFLEFLDRWK